MVGCRLKVADARRMEAAIEARDTNTSDYLRGLILDAIERPPAME